MITWRDIMSVGAPSLDADHKGLIESINATEHWTGLESWAQVELISRDLLRYVHDHFQREEAILAAMKYPDLPHHRLQHQSMASRAEMLHGKFLSATSDEDRRSCAQLLTKTLSEWLINHILKEDMKYRNFIPRKAPGRSPA